MKLRKVRGSFGSTTGRAALALMLTLGAAEAHGQDTASQPGATPAEAGSENAGGTVGEITVTARKKAESIIKAPVTITALTGDMLDLRHVEDRTDLNRFTPGFKAAPQNTSSSSRLINTYEMRGLGTVNMFWNGVPIGGGDVPELLDVQRVEVLKGPQNAYFGRSTFSGAVNFIPKMADFKTEAYVDLDFATYANRDIKGGVQGSIIDGVLAGRIAGEYRHEGGQYDNYGYGGKLGEQETDALSASLLFTPTDKLRIRLYGAYWEDHDGPNAIAYLQPSDYNCNGGAAPAGTNNYFCGAMNSAPANRISQLTNYPTSVFNSLRQAASGATVSSDFVDQKNGLRRQGLMTQVLVDYDLPLGITASAVGAYNQNLAGQIFDYGSQFYANPKTYNPSITTYRFEDTYGEFRLQSDQSKFYRLLLGVSYVDSDQWIQSVLSRSGVMSVSFPATDLYSKTFGVFGSASVDFLHYFTATAEGRWQSDKVGRYTVSTNQNLAGVTKSFVPRFILQFHARRNLEFYGSYSVGSSPGSLNTGYLSLPLYAQQQVSAQFAVPSVIPEQKLKNWEFGIKGTFFGDTLRVLAAFYDAKWTKQPNAAALFYTTPAGVLTQANVQLGSGQTNGKGVELETLWTPTHELSFDGTFAWNHTDVVKTVCATCQQITGNINPVGEAVARFPVYSASAGATYRRHIFGDYDGTFRIDANYQGKEYADITDLVWLKPYFMSNLRLGLENDHYSLGFYVINLFNNTTPQAISQTTEQITGKPVVSLTPAIKRTFGFTAGYKF